MEMTNARWIILCLLIYIGCFVNLKALHLANTYTARTVWRLNWLGEVNLIMEGHWEELPLPALVGIFTVLEFQQRLPVAFSVCSGWARAASDPRCWETTLALSDSPDEFFIKVDEPTGEPSLDHVQAIFSKSGCVGGGNGGGIDGLVPLKELVRLSQGRIKSICLSPFLSSEGGRPNDDQLLAFIADSCPNLRHLSLRGSLHASEEAMSKVIHNCRELELLDFSYSPCFNVNVVRELGRFCPQLRGIRRRGTVKYEEAAAIASNLPKLRLLNLANTTLDYDGMFAIASGCDGLEFFDVTGSWACSFDAWDGAPCPIQDVSSGFEECGPDRHDAMPSCSMVNS